MISRFFFCRKKNEPLLGAESGQAAVALKENSPKNNGCNKFWIGSEFLYKFLYQFSFTTYALATQITDIAKMKSDYEKVELANTAIYISLPFAMLFAASEAFCHYAESTLITNNNERINDANAPQPSLRWWQWGLTAAHLLADVYSDLGAILGALEAFGLKTWSDLARFGIYASATSISTVGNMQEARNGVNSMLEMNAQSDAQARRNYV